MGLGTPATKARGQQAADVVAGGVHRPAYPVGRRTAGRRPSTTIGGAHTEPLSPNSGLGMNVTLLPACHAVC